MRDRDEARRDGPEAWPSVTIDADGSYRIESGGRVGVGPDPESARRDLDRQPRPAEAAPAH